MIPSTPRTATYTATRILMTMPNPSCSPEPLTMLCKALRSAVTTLCGATEDSDCSRRESCSGELRRPYTEINAVSVGSIANSARNATPDEAMKRDRATFGERCAGRCSTTRETESAMDIACSYHALQLVVLMCRSRSTVLISFSRTAIWYAARRFGLSRERKAFQARRPRTSRTSDYYVSNARDLDQLQRVP